MPNLESATTFDSAIEIIPESRVKEGIYFLRRAFIDLFLQTDREVSVIPIERGGHDVGNYLCHPGDDIHLSTNPMRMSHYGPNNKYLGKPVCKSDPDILRIINRESGTTRSVVFAEAVVESQETIIEAMARINTLIDDYNTKNGTSYAYPEYHTFALVSKTDGDKLLIPNFHWAFKVPKIIWLHGRGCDDEKKGRKKKSFYGRLQPGVKSAPEIPYYTQNFETTT